MMNKQEIREAIYELFRLKNRLTCSQWYGIQTQEANKYTAECLRLAISALIQQLTGGWIPVSDRLPKTGNTIVLTQDKYGHIALAIYKDEKFYYLNQTNTTFIKGSVINGAIAWMPLPEPYREEDNDAERN